MIDLKGHILNKFSFDQEDQTLSLTLDGDKVFLIKVEGDCCSVGKFIGLTSDYRLSLPQKVVETEERSESFKEGEYTVYEQTYVLENGEKFTITYDNESNGYYGSSLGAYYNGELLWDFPEESATNSHLKG